MHLGIDPSKRATALAWRADLGEVWLGACYPIASHRAMKECIVEAFTCGARVAAIEHVLNVGPNMAVLSTLAEVRGRVMQMCLDAGLAVHLVTPAEWQGAMLGKLARGGKTAEERRANKAAHKRKSIEVARALGADGTILGEIGSENDNVADAVCLCEYARLNEIGAGEDAA